MIGALRLKNWAGPLTIGSFVLIAGTGILMFFHLNTGLAKVAHEWLSWLLVLGAVAHVAVNWKPLLAYFRRPAGIAIMAPLFLITAISLVPAGGAPGRPPMMEVFGTLERSSLGLLAQVARRNPESVIEDLAARGIRVRDAQQTIEEIATENGKRGMEVLGYVLATATAPAGSSQGQ